MSAIEFAKSRNCGALAALGIVRERGANQLGLRPALMRRQLPDGDGEIRVQINGGLRHLPYMVPYARNFITCVRVCVKTPLSNRFLAVAARRVLLLALESKPSRAREQAVPEAIG